MKQLELFPEEQLTLKKETNKDGISSKDINRILGISENFQLHDALMGVLFDSGKREYVFKQFLSIEDDLSYDWFTNYFQEEQSNRKSLMQDYTPDCICKIIRDISTGGGTVYDECSGIGGLTISMWNDDPDRTFYLEELSDNSVALLLFNLSIRGVNAYVRHGDVLSNTFKKCYKLTRNGQYSYIKECESDSTFKADTVISNPPYSLKFEQAEKFKNDPRFEKFGVTPKSRADYAFVLHGLSKLKPGGEMFFVLPHGVLFRGQAEAQIRRTLIENNYVDAVIGLPEKLFLNTQIPVCILILKNDRAEKDILFIDASKECDKNGKQNSMNSGHIQKIADTYKRRDEIQRYSHRAYPDEIKENEYNLNIPRYVDSYIPPKPADIGKVVDEIIRIENEISQTEKELAGLMRNLTGSEEYISNREKAVRYMECRDPHTISGILLEMNEMIERNAATLQLRKNVFLHDVSTFERSRKNKRYPSGSILLQLSASKGQLVYMEEEGEVDAKYGVIQPKGIDQKYLYYILQMVLPEFLWRFQEGLNINPDILRLLRFSVHTEWQAQKMVVGIMDNMQFLTDEENKNMEQWKEFKRYHLDNMFV